MGRGQGRGGGIFVSAALGASCPGELVCLPFPRGLRQTSPHPRQHRCILHDNFWKVLESWFFGKVLLLLLSYLPPPLPAALPLYFSLTVPTSPLYLCTAPQRTCTCLSSSLPTAAFPHIPICPLPLAEQKPRWLTARREYERDNDLF